MLRGIVGCVVPHRRIAAALVVVVLVGCSQDVDDGVFSSVSVSVSAGVATNASADDDSDTGRDGSSTSEAPMDTGDDGITGPVEDSTTGDASAEDANPTIGPLDDTSSSGPDEPTNDTTLDIGMMDDDVLPAGDCCVAHVGLGCDDAVVEMCVCGLDPVCCSTGWDDICVSQAGQCGAPCMGGGDLGDCCTVHLTPGCSNLEVESCVCFFDDFCCSTEWDDLCVGGVLDCGYFCP